MQRSAHQVARRFLSTAFRFDTKECSMKGTLPGAAGVEVNMFRLSLRDIPAAVKADGTALQFTLFDQEQHVFFGATHRAEMDQSPEAPLLFYTTTTKNVFLVVEVVRSNSTVANWAFITLGALAAGQAIDLRQGSAQLLFVDPSAWPVLQPLGQQLVVDVAFVRDTPESKSLATLIPAGVFVGRSFVREFSTSKPITKFRAALGEVEIQSTSLPSLVSSSTSWSMLFLAHNTYRQLTPVAELELVRDGDSVLKSRSLCEVRDIPLHSSTSLVAVLRCRMPDRIKVVGYAVLSICAEHQQVRDEDVVMRGVPVLRGPFSSADPRTVTLDVEDPPYGLLPLELSCLVQFYDTPIPARQVEEVAPATAAGQQVPSAQPQQQQAAAAAVAVAAGGDAAAEQPPHQPPTLLPASPGIVPTSTDGYGAHVAVPAAGTSSEASDLQMYKLLCTVLEEVQQLKEMQVHLEKKVATAQAVSAAKTQQQQTLRTDLPVPPLDADSQLLNVVDIAPRRVALPSTARGAITNGLAQLRNPITQLPLKDLEVSDTAFPDTLIGMRFEGVTVTSAVTLPTKFVVMFSFSTLPIQQLGVMHAKQVADDGDCRSFQISSTAGPGFIWHEPVDHPQSLIVKRSKSIGHIYLHLYDAVSLFYVCTATIKLSAFHRPPNAPSSSTSVDAILHVDLSFSEQQIPSGVFPIVSNVGQLHLTLFAIGFTDAQSLAAAKCAEVRGGGAAAVGGTVIATKLAALDSITTLPKSPTAAPTTTTSSSAPAATNSDKVPTLHQQRAQYVKSLLLQNGGALPGVPAEHFTANNNSEPTDLEYKLRFAEKKRDEIKSQRIAESLRERITTTVQINAAVGRPEVVRVHFTNPFPDTVRFFLSIPETSKRYLSDAPSSPPQFTLGPKDSTTTQLVVRLIEPLNQPIHLGASIVTERGEAVKLVDIRVTPSSATVDRRYEIFGAPGETVTKKFFSRVLSSNSFPLSLDAAALEKRIATLCCFCSTSDVTTVASTTAVVDPLTSRFATAWEEVLVKTSIPATGSKVVLVHLFFDEDCISPFETWELVVFSCLVTQSHNIFFGQTSTITVPFPCDRLYSSDPIVEVVAAPSGTNALRVKPRGPGIVTVLLHALRGTDLDKIVCHIPVTVPTPTFEQTIEVSSSDLATPIFRRLTFTNHATSQKIFRVNFNYRHNVSVNPEVFALGPGDHQHLGLKFERMCVPEGCAEGRYPVWLFINDEQDKTVESYFLQVVARALPVFS